LDFQLSINETSDSAAGEGAMAGLVVSRNELMSRPPQNEMDLLKEKLLTMASFAEGAVDRAIKALVRRDDEMARQTHEEDDRIDRLEMEIDEIALGLLARRPEPFDLRFVAVAMKIAHDLERVGDEATTISRRVIELSQEPQLRQASSIVELAGLALPMLKDALDAFVQGNVPKALAVIPRDRKVDALNKRLQTELADAMARRPSCISRCLSLMVISKSLERIGDHATNVAEDVVFLFEGRDIRHVALPESEAQPPASPPGAGAGAGRSPNQN
jgi:phosphate transport system protein